MGIRIENNTSLILSLKGLSQQKISSVGFLFSYLCEMYMLGFLWRIYCINDECSQIIKSSIIK